MDSSCEVRISRDGSVELMSAVQDLGTRTKTMLAIIVAEEHSSLERGYPHRRFGADYAADPPGSGAGDRECGADDHG
jgi:xanthine dehydrogenase YagR molybdenum-binding subunit